MLQGDVMLIPIDGVMIIKEIKLSGWYEQEEGGVSGQCGYAVQELWFIFQIWDRSSFS